LSYRWGIRGAAWATLLSQAVSAAMVLGYMRGFRAAELTKADFRPDLRLYGKMAAIGVRAGV